MLAFFAALWLISRNYLKVSPNAVAVLSGRKRKLPDGRVVGYRMVKGGAALRIPLLEKVEYLHLNVMTIPLEIKRAYTLKGVPVSVKAVANVKIRGDETSLQAAAERFLGMTHVEVQKVIFQTLEGHLRSILGTLTVEEVNSDRQSFAQKLTSEAAADLEKMGLGVDVLTIQEISDEEEYLNALGKRRTAEVKRDATIGEAEAMRDSKIKSAQAMQEGEKAKFQADAEIAQAQRDFAIRQAQYQAEIQTEKARAEQAGPLSEATARQAVVAEEVRVERTRTQELIAVQEQEVLRRQKELEATVIKPAEADRLAAVVRAEASKQAAILEAEGRRSALIALAEAEQEKLRKEGAGRAAAVEAEGPRRSRQDRSDRPGASQGDRGPGRRRSRGDSAQGGSVEAVQRVGAPADGTREDAGHPRGVERHLRRGGGAARQHRQAGRHRSGQRHRRRRQRCARPDRQDESGGGLQPAAAARGAGPECALRPAAARSVVGGSGGRCAACCRTAHAIARHRRKIEIPRD